MDSSTQEEIVLRLEQQDWIREHIDSLDRLTPLEKAVVRKLYEYERAKHTIHVRRLAQVLGCSAMGVSKAARKLERLHIAQSRRFGYRREKFLSLNPMYPIWINVVLSRLGFRIAIPDPGPDHAEI